MPTPPSLFASPREQWLWAASLFTVLAIYSTLLLASTLAGALPHVVTTGAFLTGMILVGATILTQGLKIRPSGLEVAIGLGIGTILFLVMLRLTLPERSHLMEYGVLAALLHEALLERRSRGRWVPVPGLLAIAATTLIGLVDELVQRFMPHRVFDTDDILFNLLAAVMAVGAGFALRWVRKWAGRD